MFDQGLFEKHFVGRDGFIWWIGQIASEISWKENIPGLPLNDNSEIKGFGERYRVRIMGYHTANINEIPDQELPWAYVMYPVTAGGGGRSSSQSANLTQGNFVFGFFLDGENGVIWNLLIKRSWLEKLGPKVGLIKKHLMTIVLLFQTIIG